MKFLSFLGLILLGLILVKYSKWITDNTMRFPSMEKLFGPTGTYTFWKIAGIGTVVLAFWYLFN